MANPFLLLGAGLSAVASLAHVGCIVFGAPWYRFFGAGERMARLAESGSAQPTLITSGIVAVLALSSLYALSAAGLFPRLPLLRLALCTITAVYLLRGVAGLVLAFAAPGDRSVAFWVVSSLICLFFGAVHLVGTQQAWVSLSRQGAG